MNLVVAIDDLHPEQGWGCEGDVQVDYLKSLNDEFGVKFTLFCPSYYHNKYKLTKDWVSYWKQFDWVELANHGHYHDIQKYPKEDFGEQEFVELDFVEANQRIQDSLEIWEHCGHKPKGFRAPGWGITQGAANAVSNYFEWVAQHEEHNQLVSFGVPNFVGCDGINETENINLYGKRIKVELLEFLRSETKFNSLSELKKQIELDTKMAYDFHKLNSL